MILQTGMRTDIPAFYTPWLLNRLRAGFVCVRNPYDPRQVTQYRLAPDVVDLLGFCTKDPAPMLPYLDALRPYGQYWFVTITPYGREIEPHVPDKRQVIASFRQLSAAVGVDSVGWRYDPILISEDYPVERHIAAFEWMAQELCGATRTCVISFLDLYEKVRRNFPEARAVSQPDRTRLGKAFVQIGRRYGLTIRACGEGDELAPYGVDCAGCMTVQTYETALHARLNVPRRKPLRAECACFLSSDIGAYNTCGHLCRYCYANCDAATVRRNQALHDPASPFLVGGPQPEDVLHLARQEKWLDPQLSLFDAL